jgi:AbiTii-like protein
LPTVLRLARRRANGELESWVRLELLGYLVENPALTDEIVVPEYRSVAGEWLDDWRRVLVLDDPKLAFVQQIRLRQGVAELEGLATATGPLMMRPLHLSQIIRERLKVEVSIFRFSPHAIVSVLSSIRAELLDRLAMAGDLVKDDSAKESISGESILQLKPSVYGIGVDLRALWKRIARRKPRSITQVSK